MPSADMDVAASIAVKARTINTRILHRGETASDPRLPFGGVKTLVMDAS